MADVRHLMGDDEVMPRVHRGLNVVADEPGALAVRRHGPRIGVGQRDLSVRRDLHERLHRLQRAQPIPECGKPLLQAWGSNLRHIGLLTVGGIEGRKVAHDARLDLLEGPSDRGRGEISVARVHGLEPTAVNGHGASGQKADLPAEHHEVPTGGAKRVPVLAPEVRDRIEVGCKAADQPHQLDIAAGLPLQAPARRDLVQVPYRSSFDSVAG